MNKTVKVTPYPLPPEGVELMKSYRDIMESMNDDLDRIQKESQDKMLAIQQSAIEEAKRVWYQMAPLVGLDAEKSWATGEYGVDSRYVDHGFAAINHIPMAGAPNPFAHLMGEKEEEPEPDMPKGTTLN